MIIAERWKDYELLDCGSGEKFERWQQIRLIRPDPQAIWPHGPWRGADANYKRSSRGGGQWSDLSRLPKSWIVEYPGLCRTLRFQVEPTGFKHTGLFPEQAANWDYLSERIQAARSAGRAYRVLNLFAYTGGASVAAAAAGATEVCHVDAAKGMNQRAKENLSLSTLADAPVRILTDDVLKFVQREIRRGHRYQAIILDPPSYGRGPNGEVWQLEDRLYGLLTELAELFDPHEEEACVILNAYTTGLQASVLSNLLMLSLMKKCPQGRAYADEIGLRCSQRPLILPCGATGHFEAGSFR